jgi:hypothetical protein
MAPACFQGHRRLLVGNRSPPKCLTKASASFRLGKAEHHEVAVIAAQGVRELRRG